MPKVSAGILLYRLRSGDIEVFLVHPGGPYWSGKDLRAWSIPKGLVDPGEDPLDAARREFREETGFSIEGYFVPLSPRKQPSGKVILAWAVEGDCDASSAKSNTFRIEWPPGSGRQQDFPEVDRAAWFSAGEAKQKVVLGQVGLIEELEHVLKNKK